ncbi:MAG: hypothetical protein Q4B08_06140 [Propionibacteriaceae bacterium]|nr:hypothetical protein [Propionibacteriaceae bacterium]
MPTTNERPAQPREFGRDGVSGMVSRDRAIRAREVSKPSPTDFSAAHNTIDQLIARAQGRRPR